MGSNAKFVNFSLMVNRYHLLSGIVDALKNVKQRLNNENPKIKNLKIKAKLEL